MNLNQVTIPSLDVSRSIEFYERLGLQLIVHTHDAYARVECPEGDSTFSVHLVEAVPPEGVWVYFEVNDVTAKIKELEAKGIAFDLPPQNSRGYGQRPVSKIRMGIELLSFMQGSRERIHPGERRDK